METALFDPEDGYYTTRASLGFEGDFVTSPDLGPAFGRSLARGIADLWLIMGKPPTWDLVEAGAGRGILMRDLLGALERERPDAARGARPAIVEVSPRMRAQQSLALEGGALLAAAVACAGLRRGAEGAGLRLAGTWTQAGGRAALGIREATGRAATPVEQLREASRRSAVGALLDANGRGAFKVVCLAKGAASE